VQESNRLFYKLFQLMCDLQVVLYCVDNAYSMVLAAMLDKVTRAYDLESKHLAINYVGYEEAVRGIDNFPEEGPYINGSINLRLISQAAKCRLTVS